MTTHGYFFPSFPLSSLLSSLPPSAKLKEGSVAEDEVAFARSQGVVSVNNPLMRMGMKEEDAAGNPLYLTPDELTDFEQQMTGTMTS